MSQNRSSWRLNIADLQCENGTWLIFFFLTRFLDLFEKYGGYKTGHLKLKKPKQLQEVLDIVRHLLSKVDSKDDPEIAEKKAKLNQLKLVLEM